MAGQDPGRRQRPASHSPAEYLTALADAGLEPDVWETTYTYVIDSDPAADAPSGVTEFVRGTALRPIVTTLSDSDAADFVAEYDALVRVAYPIRRLGARTVRLLPYRRIFAVGRKAS